MTAWAPQKQDVIDEFARELTSVYSRGKAAIAVQAHDATESLTFANELSAAIAATGRSSRVSDVADAVDDTVTVYGGDVTMDAANATRWNVTVWLDHALDADRARRKDSGVVFDVTDPEHPRRRFADSC
jgi:hypothetical protein